MKKISTILLSLSTLALIGCGGGSSKIVNKEVSSMSERFNYFQNGELISGHNTTCHPNLLFGDSYTIQTTITHENKNTGNIYFTIERYRKKDCTESVGWSSSTYDYTLDSNVTDDKRVGIKLVNTSYNIDEKDFEIEKMIANLIFGTPLLGNPYYTNIVGAGDIRTDKIKIGFAHPTVTHDGSTPDKRAIDTSDYIEQIYYLKEQEDN